MSGMKKGGTSAGGGPDHPAMSALGRLCDLIPDSRCGRAGSPAAILEEWLFAATIALPLLADVRQWFLSRSVLRSEERALLTRIDELIPRE